MRDDVLDAPAATSSSARCCEDEVWSAAARSATHGGECGTVDRGDGKCASSLEPCVPCVRASTRPAETVARPRTAPVVMDWMQRRRLGQLRVTFGERPPARARRRRESSCSAGRRHGAGRAGPQRRSMASNWSSTAPLPFVLHREVSDMKRFCTKYSKLSPGADRKGYSCRLYRSIRNK